LKGQSRRLKKEKKGKLKNDQLGCKIPGATSWKKKKKKKKKLHIGRASRKKSGGT